MWGLGARAGSLGIQHSVSSRLAGEQIYYAPSFHDRQSSWYVLLLIYYGQIANRTNFFFIIVRLVIIQATRSINIHVERLITISAELSTVYNFLV